MINHETLLTEITHEYPRCLFVSEALVNVVDGVVQAHHMSPIHPTVRIGAGRGIEVRIRLPIEDDRCFFQGQPVVAAIPAEAVRLEAGFFRQSRQRLNRWYGRIVLVKPQDDGHLITAKLHGEGVTLTSRRPVLGTTHAPRTWDPVTIVIDPHRITLFPRQRPALRESTCWKLPLLTHQKRSRHEHIPSTSFHRISR
ncbi:MAG TPA: hypothetical protein VFX10_09395, partial [Nitrospira sp.]|nr:hypothetical protein [Nitrospira sp.]